MHNSSPQSARVSIIAVAPFVRLMYYTNGVRAPITLVQWIKQRRFLVADYDAVYLGPAVGFIAGALVLLVGYAVGMATPIITGLSIFACLLALCAVGPSRQRWQLTANHRVATPSTRAVVTS